MMGAAILAIVIKPNIVKSKNDANPAMQLMNVKCKDFARRCLKKTPLRI